MSTSNTLPNAVTVDTPNGPLSINRSTNLDLQLPSGVIRTAALVNPKMTHHRISAIPISQQHGTILLADKITAVLPRDEPMTRKLMTISTPIATVRNGIYVLRTPPPLK